MGIAAGAMQQKDGIVGVTLGVAVQLPEREVVEVQDRERLTGVEAEVPNVEASVLDGPMSRRVLWLRGLGGSGDGECQEEKAGKSWHKILLSTCTRQRIQCPQQAEFIDLVGHVLTQRL